MIGARRLITTQPVSGAPEITDDFNRADGSLGADWGTPSGAGVAAISGNRWYQDGNSNATSIHLTSLSSADHYVQIEVVTTNIDMSVLARCNPSTLPQTYYLGRHGTSSSNKYEIFKRVSGSFTLLAASGVESPPSVPWTLRLEVDGSALRLYADGVLKVSTTDSSITGTTGVGLRANGASYADDFEASSL